MAREDIIISLLGQLYDRRQKDPPKQNEQLQKILLANDVASGDDSQIAAFVATKSALKWGGLQALQPNLFPNSSSFEECSGQHVGVVTNSNGVTTNLGGGWSASTQYNTATIAIVDDPLTNLRSRKRLSYIHDGSTGWKGAHAAWSVQPGKTYTAAVWARANQASAQAHAPGYPFYATGFTPGFSWAANPLLNPGVWCMGVATFSPPAVLTGSMYLYGVTNGEAGLVLDYDGILVVEGGAQPTMQAAGWKWGPGGGGEWKP